MKDNMKLKVESEFVKKSNWYNEFLWWCAGVNRHILRQCPTEYAKYAGMGGTIFSTACMAALSGGYAISTVFDNTLIAILFGLFWGFVIIFNLDRLIVNTMYSDGKVTISWKEFCSGLPRIVIALILGFVISIPLELKIYEKSIDTQIEGLKEKELAKYVAKDEAKLAELELKLDEISNMPLTDVETEDAADVFSDANKQRKILITQRDQYIVDIRTLIARRRNVSQTENAKEYQRLTNLINTKAQKRNQLNRQIDDLGRTMKNSNSKRQTTIENNRKRRDEQLKVINKDIVDLKLKIENAKKVYAPKLSKKYDGFQGRVDAFHNLQQPIFSSTWWAAHLISLLFIIIECAPTVMRMMVADGSYEKLLEAEQYKFKKLSEKRIFDINNEVNAEIELSTKKTKQRVEAEVLANKELMEKLAKAQAKLLETAIEEWRKQESEKIRENPSAYIAMTSKEEKA